MNEAINELTRAKREATARLTRYEQEGKASAHKLPHVRQAIRELDAALAALKCANEYRLVFVRLWQLVEEGNRSSVQILSGEAKRRTSRRPQDNRRRT